MHNTGTGPVRQKSKQRDPNAQVIEVLSGRVAEATRARRSVKNGESRRSKPAHEDVAKCEIRRKHGVKNQWRRKADEQAEIGIAW